MAALPMTRIQRITAISTTILALASCPCQIWRRLVVNCELATFADPRAAGMLYLQQVVGLDGLDALERHLRDIPRLALVDPRDETDRVVQVCRIN